MTTLFDASSDFDVDLDVYSGPFSVLLTMISKKNLDITEVALAEVTDEFIAWIRSRPEVDLSTTSEFLVVAATLLDMKLARLLPRHESEEEDWELLEQRDLLFAKLLQYRAFKEVARDFGERLGETGRRVGRDVPLEEMYAKALPEVRLPLGVMDLALLAARAFTRDTSEPVVQLEHLHSPVVPVASQVAYLEKRFQAGESFTFTQLCADAGSVQVVVARFLAVLELLRRGAIAAEQDEPLGALVLRPTPADDRGAAGAGDIAAEYGEVSATATPGSD
ncbi:MULTISPECIES: segregation and condensation protein A [Actinotignum]|uniref:segregation and condensation protein A n=1 Tax=Actinotignum TaxID=1653174 RepID=UPI00254EE1E5|nr:MULTISPECIES: ScpA family protein [Actinotignum]MDE1536441.1 ScpA family protein [Actinotignum schaalii]MDK7272014.1 ScpA family protein [Actinotignum schaalii]MDY5133969.1 ScpA family protein [Actinotignum timonense]MDY5144161.1 ScpA family protein [Actinotignum timonense]